MRLKFVASVFALALMAGAAFVSVGSKQETASAAPVTITVTHWTSDGTTYADGGTVSGAVGNGTVTGQLTGYTAGPPVKASHTMTLNGSAQTMSITINSTDAAITGTVTDGWLKGQNFTGSYTGSAPCSQAKDASGLCYTFQFTVDAPASGGTGGTTTTPPAVGTGLAAQHESSPLVSWGLALMAAGAAGFAVTTWRRSAR